LKTKESSIQPIDSVDSFVDHRPETLTSLEEYQAPSTLSRSLSEISEESPLYNILDTGRLQKKFHDITKIGQGGFGQVFRATYHVDQKQYAIKVVRLHIIKSKSVNPMHQIYQHRVYRELQWASRITSDNIVRYFNSWFEELDPKEKEIEVTYRLNY